jgi:diaminohydroxyphosphoribosylaminopyrimidine deaminase / 5-amino-6-(5-phosphoribosylamino)uracil reductase
VNSFDKKIMKRLLQIAEKKKGISNPNPFTAAAVVKDGAIIAEGSHNKFGTPHAEALALIEAGKKAVGSKLYVNLEPCTHWGNNPPCTDLIIKAGIKEVVYAIKDPNPDVKRNPAKKILTNAGIKVRDGLLEDDALLLNEIFFKNKILNKTFVTAKIAMSLDGKIALGNGQSKYLTSKKALRQVHMMRKESDAIVVGIGTILADNPSLNLRFGLDKKFRNPIKIILDSNGRTPENAKVFNENTDTKIIIVTKKETIKNRKLDWAKDKAEIWEVPTDTTGSLSWKKILEKTFKNGIGSIFIEGGQKVYTSALEAGIIDKLHTFIAPKILAGEKSLSPFSGQGIISLDKAYTLKEMKIKKVDPDILITGYLTHPKEWFY